MTNPLLPGVPASTPPGLHSGPRGRRGSDAAGQDANEADFAMVLLGLPLGLQNAATMGTAAAPGAGTAAAPRSAITPVNAGSLAASVMNRVDPDGDRAGSAPQASLAPSDALLGTAPESTAGEVGELAPAAPTTATPTTATPTTATPTTAMPRTATPPTTGRPTLATPRAGAATGAGTATTGPVPAGVPRAGATSAAATCSSAAVHSLDHITQAGAVRPASHVDQAQAVLGSAASSSAPATDARATVATATVATATVDRPIGATAISGPATVGTVIFDRAAGAATTSAARTGAATIADPVDATVTTATPAQATGATAGSVNPTDPTASVDSTTAAPTNTWPQTAADLSAVAPAPAPLAAASASPGTLRPLDRVRVAAEVRPAGFVDQRRVSAGARQTEGTLPPATVAEIEPGSAPLRSGREDGRSAEVASSPRPASGEPAASSGVSGPAAAVLASQPTATALVDISLPAYAPAEPLRAETPIVSVLSKLRGHDGKHELTVELHPAELGAVTVRASIHNGAITVSLDCADPAAHAAVSAALPNLQHELHANGFSGVDVSLGQQTQQQHPNSSGRAAAQHSPAGRAHSERTDDQPAPRPRSGRTATSRGVDRWL